MALRFEYPNAVNISFPDLHKTDYEITSDFTQIYNCMAWAAEDTNRRWWPRYDEQLEEQGYYWPPGLPEENTIKTFILCFESLGYEVCDNGNLESEYEKIAIYTRNEKPQHVARQRPNGKWASKLGDDADIEHEISALDGPLYGRVEVVMRRKRK